jgi:thiosulfate/3-mercaptopyruvate sulfurtransferase
VTGRAALLRKSAYVDAMRRINWLSVTFVLSLVLSAPLHAQLLVSTDWLQAHRHDKRTVIVEIGDRASYEAQHIAGARFIALSDLLIERNGIPNELPEIPALERTFTAAGIGNRDRIILYSRDVIAATRAFFTLDYLGHGDSTSLLDGGFAKWNAENRAVEASAPVLVAKTADFQARPRVGTIARLKAMEVLVDCLPVLDGSWAIVDARSPEQFSGAEPGTGIKRGGHIQGALNVPWNENLTSSAAPVFRTRDELEALYGDAGVSAKTSVVVYCRTGMQASVNYFVLRYLGRDVALYDASYIEWNRGPHPQMSSGREDIGR